MEGKKKRLAALDAACLRPCCYLFVFLLNFRAMDASCIYIHSLYIIQVGRELRRQCTHAQQLCVPCHLFVLFVFIISFSSSFFFFLFGKSKWQFQISASLPCWCHRLSFSRTDSFVWIHGYGRVGRMVPRA